LTAHDDPDDPSAAPSPFSREKIKVYEEPRLREQDFGNFQPDSAEMERMWHERAAYGHFFYRIPNGESASDAYDRISGFNESLWRQFGEHEFPSVCVLVTHGLMTRVFLMKWYHWSVEYFEDLRNINHCEFITMQQNLDNGKYILQNQLRTWSELKRQRREQEARDNPQRRNTLSNFLKHPQESPAIMPRKWDNQNNHDSANQAPKGTFTAKKPLQLPSAAEAETSRGDKTGEQGSELSRARSNDTPAGGKLPLRPEVVRFLHTGRDGGGTNSGSNTPHEMSDEENSEYFDPSGQNRVKSMQKSPKRKATTDDIERWARESGMRQHAMADALGDENTVYENQHEHATDDSVEDLEKAEKEDKGIRGSVY
jgi:broad specificity phosphatase PhoE